MLALKEGQQPLLRHTFIVDAILNGWHVQWAVGENFVDEGTAAYPRGAAHILKQGRSHPPLPV